MKDKPKMLSLVIIVLCLACLAIVTIILQLKKSERCDEHVILEDGIEYDCKSVTSFNSGVSTINLCDGERITVPTYRIKMISRIKE